MRVGLRVVVGLCCRVWNEVLRIVLSVMGCNGISLGFGGGV